MSYGMDSIFLLDERGRANFFQHIMRSFACTTSYICLWSYFQPSNSLLFMDGFYHEENKQPGFSSPARRLFDEYRQSEFTVNGCIPGLAFKNSLPYIEIKDVDLLSLASIESQLQFYQEARIKTAIFMGCKTGEIELGMSSATPVNMGVEMIKKWFLEDFSGQPLLREIPLIPTDQNRPSSSSSSLRSPISIDSNDCSAPFLYNTTTPSTTMAYNVISKPPKEVPIEQLLGGRPFISTTTSTTTTSPHHQAIQALSQIRNMNHQFPTLIESEDAAMTKAILAIISSSASASSSSSSSSSSSHQSAFRNYRSVLAPASTTHQFTTKLQKQNMLKRAFTFFRRLSLVMQNQDQGSRPTSTHQLHHMISERRRREKLNESFQALRSLLPSGSKKDKASVLTSTMEYVSSLKAQVAELAGRNQLLEAQLLPAKEGDREVINDYSNGRFDVQVTSIAESTSEERMVDLRVILRGECVLLDFAIRILEFLKLVKNVSLMSTEAETRIVGSNPINRLILKLKIEGSDWDESTFQEAMRKVVADLAQ